MMVIGEIHYRNIAILLGCVLGLLAAGMALVLVFRLLRARGKNLVA
jgi:NO-binding membrane sensor protein with MHYT domain